MDGADLPHPPRADKLVKDRGKGTEVPRGHLDRMRGSSEEVIRLIHLQGRFPEEVTSKLICKAGMEETNGKGVLGVGEKGRDSGWRRVLAHTGETQHVTCPGGGKQCGSVGS